MSDQQESPNHILNCNNCGTVTVIPKDAPFTYEDDFCQTCGKSYFEAPPPAIISTSTRFSSPLGS